MKNKIINQKSVFILIFALFGTVALGLTSINTQEPLSDIELANIEALSDIEQINGNYYIVDQIPCASSAREVRVDCSYINCFKCKPEAGKADGNTGSCTNVRTLP